MMVPDTSSSSSGDEELEHWEDFLAQLRRRREGRSGGRGRRRGRGRGRGRGRVSLGAVQKSADTFETLKNNG